MKMEEKIEGRKVQILPFLLSRNMRKDTLKNNGFCPNEVIHFTKLLEKTLMRWAGTLMLVPLSLLKECSL